METSLIISATNGGKKVTKAIANVNPEKDNAILKTFAQKVNDLTTNQYVDATRINKQSVNEEGGGSSTPVVTLHVDATEAPTGAIETGYGGFETIEGGIRIFYGADPQGCDGYLDVTYTVE